MFALSHLFSLVNASLIQYWNRSLLGWYILTLVSSAKRICWNCKFRFWGRLLKCIRERAGTTYRSLKNSMLYNTPVCNNSENQRVVLWDLELLWQWTWRLWSPKFWHSVLFIYGLFSDTVSISHYITSVIGQLMNIELEGCGRKQSWPNWKHCTVLEFAWRDGGKPPKKKKKNTFRWAILRAEILTLDLLSTTQVYQQVNWNVGSVERYQHFVGACCFQLVFTFLHLWWRQQGSLKPTSPIYC